MIRVTILGCASAKPTVSKHPSSQVVNVNEQYFLVDAGEGTQQQMFREGINPLKLRAVFLSHLHGDHVFGIFPLLSTLSLYGKRTPLDVYAPAPFGRMLSHFLEDFEDDLQYEVVWHEVDTTSRMLLMENKTMEVWSLPLRHSLPSSGFLFREKSPERNVDKFAIERYSLSLKQILAAKRGEDVWLEDGTLLENSRITYLPREPKAYAYCSDTSRVTSLADALQGVSMLYHEATYSVQMKKVAKERGHSTSVDAAELALKCGAGKLIIGHLSSRYKDGGELVQEARQIFENTEEAQEGMTYVL